MRTALIPPIPELGRYKSTGVHLLLAHLLEDERYARYYAEASARGDYIILDNSAHEHGKGNPIDVLLGLARRVQANEIVVPDVLFDRSLTVMGTKKTLEYLRTEDGELDYMTAGSPTLMLVPQGTDRKDWKDCLQAQVLLWRAHLSICDLPNTTKVVIGVSKDYDYVRGGIASLIQDLKVYRQVVPGIEVHCLGWPSDLWSIAKVARQHPWVRSTDSAKSFVYAKNGILLEPGGDVPRYPRRDDEYFTQELTAAQREIAHRNVEVFAAAASDEILV